MLKLIFKNFWDVVARLILRNKISILLGVLSYTFISTQWKYMRFTYTEANLLPDDHEVNLTYNDFLNIFGEEGNLIILGVKDHTLFTVENLNAWNNLSNTFRNDPNVETVVSIKDLQKLIKDNETKNLNLEPFIKDSIHSKELENFKMRLFEKYPFYDNFLFNNETKTIRSAIYLKKGYCKYACKKRFCCKILSKN